MLVRLLPETEIDDPEANMSIVYPNRQYLPAKTLRFVDYAIEHFQRAGDASGRNTVTPAALPASSHAALRPVNGTPGNSAALHMSNGV
ncbi:hypothetical protein [Paraburkholderia sp. A1RO-1]